MSVIRSSRIKTFFSKKNTGLHKRPLKLEGNRPCCQGCSIFNVALKSAADLVNLELRGRTLCRLVLRATNIFFFLHKTEGKSALFEKLNFAQIVDYIYKLI